MNGTTRAVLVFVSVLAAIAVWGLVIRSPSGAHSRDASGSPERVLPAEYQAPTFPDRAAYVGVSGSHARRQLRDAAASAFANAKFDPGEVKSIRDSVDATVAVLALGDVETYKAYRFAYGCTMKQSAEALADQQFGMGNVPNIDESRWAEMSPADKFDAVASTPDARGARILSIAVDSVRVGTGQRGSIPKGFRAQGLNSGFAPPSPDLFSVGADTEWAWMEVPITLAATDEALLRLEFVRDPAVNAWIAHRVTLLAPQSVKLPWIVF